MQQDHYKRYIEEQNGLFNRMQEIQSAAEQAGEWSAEQRTNWDAANTRITEVSAKLDEHAADEQRAARMRELDSVDYSRVISTSPADAPTESPEARAEKRDSEYANAFGSYMRGGLERLTVEQRQLLLANAADDTEVRAQAVTPGSAGGYLIPPGYRQVIVETMKAYGGLMQHANVINTATGNPLQWPTNDDTGNAGMILTENTTASEVGVTFGTRTLGAYMYSSNLVKASLQILQDSAFNLDTWLPTRLGVRLGRIVASHLISGTGTGQPEGVATNATVAVTGADTTAISYDNLIDLEHSLDPAYRANQCRFLFHDQTLASLRKLKDGFGRPIWLPVPTPGFPATINGLPYTIDQGMAVPGASAKSILFGDFQAGYIVRSVLDMNLVRFGERYMDALQVGFLAFMRLDARPDDPAAVRAFQHHA